MHLKAPKVKKNTAVRRSREKNNEKSVKQVIYGFNGRNFGKGGSFRAPNISLQRRYFLESIPISAFRVLQRQSGLRLKKKFIKAVSCEVISLGFPDVTLERIFRKQELEYIDEKIISISCDDLDLQAYQRWFDAVPSVELSENLQQHQPESRKVNINDAVLRKIKEFRIEESTPMDCMIFLVSVRKELIEYGGI